jgi:hypothetical protein
MEPRSGPKVKVRLFQQRLYNGSMVARAISSCLNCRDIEEDSDSKIWQGKQQTIGELTIMNE